MQRSPRVLARGGIGTGGGIEWRVPLKSTGGDPRYQRVEERRRSRRENWNLSLTPIAAVAGAVAMIAGIIAAIPVIELWLR